MATITDAFGTWTQLGEVSFEAYNTWVEFPFTSDPIESGIYRLSFISSNFGAINSSGWIRAIYTSGEQRGVTQSGKVYPKGIPLILDFHPLLPGQTAQGFQIKKIIRNQRTDFAWSCRLEEIQLPAFINPVFLYQLDSIGRLQRVSSSSPQGTTTIANTLIGAGLPFI